MPIQAYKNLHLEFPAIINCLEEQILVRSNWDARVREKADKARQLSGLEDLYGVVANIAQMVRLLPHETYEQKTALYSWNKSPCRFS